MITTAISALIFLTGFGLLVFGPKSAQSGKLATAADAPPPPADAPPPAPPEPPDDMLYVPPLAGMRGFFVDRAAVTNAAYAEKVKAHRYAKALGDRPVTGASFAQAQAYARKRGKRLLRTDEWDRALAADRFAPAGMRIWEWVDDGVPSARERHVRKGGESGHRPPAGRPDIGFRLALDAPD